jgi:succinylarginine dihydrolase
MATIEINFDGIPGPTHHYGGLAVGNLASQAHTNQPSNPRQAALEGLAKMKFMADMGVSQAVLPPHERPDVFALRKLGFSGNDAQVLDSAKAFPWLLASCGSASAMWAANAATVSSSADCADGRIHFTAANLTSQFHRSLEAGTTSLILKKIFADDSAFVHHDPLPGSRVFSDEGAANHVRLGSSHGERGLEIFVFGRQASAKAQLQQGQFPLRQSLEASESIGRLHQLEAKDTIFVRQNSEAIEAGAFHNDVVCVGNLNVLFYHERAYAESPAARIRAWFGQKPCHLIEVRESEIPLADAVSSYVFNSQIVSLADGTMALIAPAESWDNPRTRKFLDELPDRDTPIRKVHFVDVRQSMNNGGGPACLRLRVPLNDCERGLVNPGVFLTDTLYETLKSWVNRHYRDRLVPEDLGDPELLEESRRALDELTGLLGLGVVYRFQRG